MRGQKGGLKDRYISYRMKNAKIRKKKENLDFLEFEKLLDFNENDNKIFVTLIRMPVITEKEKENIILDRTNPMRDKVSLFANIMEDTSDLDFSMFDNLLDDFDKFEIPKVIIPKKSNKMEKLNLLKREINVYQSKIGSNYNLEELEIYESKLLSLKDKIDGLRSKYSFAFYDYKFNSTTLKELVIALENCKRELELIEKKENIDRLTKKQIIDKIDTKINLNIEKQKQLLSAIKKEVDKLNDKVVSKLYFCMVKRMIFNLYRLIIGLYKVENNKKNHLKLNTGIFLIINALVGIKKAVYMDFSNDGYYYYKDYVKTDLSSKEIIIINRDMMYNSLKLIDDLQIDLKANFSKFKDYSKEYEEVYFKLSKFRSLIENQKKQCENILDLLAQYEKKRIKK